MVLGTGVGVHARRGRAAVGVVLGVLLLSGCTSDGSPPSDASATTSSATGGPGAPLGGYAGDFDAVTQDFHARSEDLQARVDTTTSDVTEVLAFYRELRDIAADARAQYGALTVPSQLQSVNQNILQLFDRQVELLDDLIAAGERDDQPAVTAAVQGLVDLTTEFDAARRAVEQAIVACGRPCIS